uniref:DGQHR domain-containing protein n=1 Tax=Acinetobacter colistiniresistens TaxID=280145 RepID=UPI00124FA74C
MSNIFPSLRAIMGNWVYYPILMSASEISDRVMRSKDIRENKTLDDYLQREITPNVKKILSYIKNNEDRFFNSIIVGVFDDTPNWYPLDLKHVDILSDERREYIEDSMGLLELKGSEKLFAIDGQHRIEAIKREVLDNPDYKDQFSIILVQHVDSISGKKRTRKLFSDINKKAVKVSDGELAIIDEEELENIVARKIYSEYERIPHTSIELSKVTEVKNPKYFTSLLTIVSIARKLKTKLKVKTEDNLYKEVKSFFDLG